MLKQQVDASSRKLRLTDRERRTLAKKGKLLGWAGLQKYKLADLGGVRLII